jgi:serine/threonine-protein kinase
MSMLIKPCLVLVDDEERILRSLAMLFRSTYELHVTTDARTALEYVRTHPVHVIISDQRMPIMRGADLLRQVREISPNTMRLLLTGYAELESIVSSVNEGEIFRFINKPWDAAELRSTVALAAEIALSLASAPLPELLPGAEMASAILVIDDDADVYKAVQEIMGPVQTVYWASSLDQAFDLLEKHNIGVVLSELFVRREAIALTLKLLKAHHPEVVTMVMTPFQDTTVLIKLINEGQVYRFLPKPIRRGPLGMSIQSALKHHQQLRSAPKLAQRHAVERTREPEDPGIAARMLGFLGRLRSRARA